MKNVLAYIFIALTAVACSPSDGHFRLEGQFKNLNQGDFYIYNLENGQKDTIHVSDGRFLYTRDIDDTITLRLLFPNYSEIPIFAHPGAKVRIKGDVSHLKETTVEGTETNKEMTDFRMSIATLSPPEAKRKAAEYISSRPSSPVCTYLLQRFFILTAEPDYDEAHTLCQAMTAAQPDNAALRQLEKQLKSLTHSRKTGKLPPFKATDTSGRTVSQADLKADVNVIFVWASWNYDSQHAMRLVNLAMKEHRGRISAVGISLDASADMARRQLERDSILWASVCTGEMWLTPALSQLGIATLPANILADSHGNIVERNLPPNQLKKRIDEMLEQQ